jgi:hypothetical protein
MHLLAAYKALSSGSSAGQEHAAIGTACICIRLVLWGVVCGSAEMLIRCTYLQACENPGFTLPEVCIQQDF